MVACSLSAAAHFFKFQECRNNLSDVMKFTCSIRERAGLIFLMAALHYSASCELALARCAYAIMQ